MPGSPGHTTAGRRATTGAGHGCPAGHVPGLQIGADVANLLAVDLEEADPVVPEASPAGAVPPPLTRLHRGQPVPDKEPLPATSSRLARRPALPPRRSSVRWR